MSNGQSKPEVVYLGDPPPSNALGVVGFIFALIGVVTCGILSPLALLISLIGMLKAPRSFATAGSILGLLGTAWLAALGFAAAKGLIVAQSAIESQAQTFATVSAFTVGKDAVEDYRKEHGELPDGVDGNKLVLDLRDGWQREIRYSLDGDSFILRSPGPDGEFHTADDLTSDQYADVRIGSGDDTIRFGPGGLSVESDGERVRMGFGGIEVDSGDEQVRIGPGGIHVKDGDETVKLTPGGIEVGPNGTIEINGGSIKVRDGDEKVEVSVPGVTVTREGKDD